MGTCSCNRVIKLEPWGNSWENLESRRNYFSEKVTVTKMRKVRKATDEQETRIRRSKHEVQGRAFCDWKIGRIYVDETGAWREGIKCRGRRRNSCKPCLLWHISGNKVRDTVKGYDQVSIQIDSYDCVIQNGWQGNMVETRESIAVEKALESFISKIGRI